MTIKLTSAKAKARNLQRLVRLMILGTFPSLQHEDVRSTSMGVTGPDLQFSPLALKLVNYDIECKNCEKGSLWAAWKQLCDRGSDNLGKLIIVKKNRSQILAFALRTELVYMITKVYVDRWDDTSDMTIGPFRVYHRKSPAYSTWTGWDDIRKLSEHPILILERKGQLTLAGLLATDFFQLLYDFNLSQI